MSEQTHIENDDQSIARAHKMAAGIAVAEEKERRSRIRDQAKLARAKRDEESGTIVLDDGRAIPVQPMAAFLQSPTVDCTAIPKELIKSDKDGPYMTRWVRKVDDFDRPSDREITLRKAYGYEFILKDGQPLEFGREFLAMQAPASAVANWICRTAKPGSTVYERTADQLEDMVEAHNKRAGFREVELVTDESDGRQDPSTVTFR